ncbi:hypothetical protein ACFY71_37765 [Streptomyces cinerochromogenes]|uniref:hypothetical protein n=1 Tax=Streptomyces cinerochromogenes TaxID=66422 RepID=UPI00369552F3
MGSGRTRPDKNRVIGLLIAVVAVAVEIPLGLLVFGEHALWAYALFEILLIVPVISLLVAFTDDDAPPGPRLPGRRRGRPRPVGPLFRLLPEDAVRGSPLWSP